jgi:integrase
MASVTYYLDKRSRKKDGTYPLKLTVSHKQKPFHVPLDVSVPEANWIDNRIEGDVPNRSFLNSYIRARFSAVENLLLRLKLNGKLDKTSPEELKSLVKNIDAGQDDETEKTSGENLPFAAHARSFIDTRVADGTKETYRYTLDAIGRHHDLEALTFGDIDYDWLEEFDMKLRATCGVNTRSIHLRNIRAIYKDANKKKLVSKDLYPFDDFTIRTEETEHRDLSVEELRRLRDYPVEPHQEQYRDLFMLHFYLIGINTVDILHAASIRNGRLQYRRAKTGRLYNIKIQPEALEIINRYSPGKKYLLNFLDGYKNYKDFRSRFNRNLKEIGPWEWVSAKSKNGRGIKIKQRSPLLPFLSSYYARHTWATLASELDIPEKTIQMALGHGKKSVTDRYVNFNMKKVDEANRKVIDYVLKKKKPGN